MKKISLISLLALCISQAAYADQCQLVNQEQASDALDFIKPGSQYVEFCEPCGDKNFYDQSVSKVNHLKAVYADNYWEIFVNNKSIDLAYTYIKGSDGTFMNLSKLAACPSDSVSIGFTAKKEKN